MKKKPEQLTPAQLAWIDALAEQDALDLERERKHELVRERKREEARNRPKPTPSQIALGELWRFLEAVRECDRFVVDEIRDAFKARDDKSPINALDELQEQASAIAKKLRRYTEHEVRTMDEALGVERPRGYRRGAERKRFLKKEKVQEDGRLLRTHGAKVDEAFFEVLGSIHKIGKTLASEWYYEIRPRPKPVAGKKRAELPYHLRAHIDTLNW